MERSSRLKETADRADFRNGYDLEQQLAVAERRYAEARGAFDKAREEVRALSVQKDAKPQLVESARTKVAAVAARCGRLRTLIESLEEKLDV